MVGRVRITYMRGKHYDYIFVVGQYGQRYHYQPGVGKVKTINLVSPFIIYLLLRISYNLHIT